MFFYNNKRFLRKTKMQEREGIFAGLASMYYRGSKVFFFFFFLRKVKLNCQFIYNNNSVNDYTNIGGSYSIQKT